MHEHHCAPFAEERQQPVEGRVPEIEPGVVGQQHDAICLQHIERMSRLADGAVGVADGLIEGRVLRGHVVVVGVDAPHVRGQAARALRRPRVGAGRDP